MHLDQTDPTWGQLAPLLDQAMARLSATDRDAVLLRYFQNKSSREVGLALGVNEGTAQKRIARAVEKLRTFCTRRGVILPAIVFTTVISANAVQAAPVGLATTTVAMVNGAALSGSTTALVSGTMKWLTWAKYKTALTFGVGFLILSGTVTCLEWSLLFPLRYQGRPIGVWLTQLEDRNPENSMTLPWRNLQPGTSQTQRQADAAQAVHALGADAFAPLLSELGRENTWIYRLFYSSMPPLEVRRHRAALAFEVLGPEAKPLAGQLKHLLYKSKNPKEVARALAAIGPAGWQVLSDAISNTNPTVAGCSIWALGTHRAAVPGTVDQLKIFLEHDVPDGITGLSGWALAEIGQDREEVISLLTRELDSPREDTRYSCAVCLGRIGPEARSAVPSLLAHLRDSSRVVRHDAAQALEQIDPSAAVQAGVTGALATEHVPVTVL